MGTQKQIRVYKEDRHIGSIEWEDGTFAITKHNQITNKFGDYDFYSYEKQDNESDNHILISYSYKDKYYFDYNTNTKEKIIIILK